MAYELMTNDMQEDGGSDIHNVQTRKDGTVSASRSIRGSYQNLHLQSNGNVRNMLHECDQNTY